MVTDIDQQLEHEIEYAQHQFPESMREKLARQGHRQDMLCQLLEAIVSVATYDTTAEEAYSAFLDAAYSEPYSTQDIIASAMDWYEQRDPISFQAVEEGFGLFLDTLALECSHDPYESEVSSEVQRKYQDQCGNKKPICKKECQARTLQRRV